MKCLKSLSCSLIWLAFLHFGANCLFAAERPNVLFIAVDDLNDWVSLFGGNKQAVTRHLDQFAASGAVVFQNAHCAGPVCCPSRSALLSGFMPSRSGVYSNSQNMRDSDLVKTHATLPEYFSKNGYVTISMGKIFHRHGTPNGADAGQWAFDLFENTRGGSPVDRSRLTSRDKNLINGKPGPPSEYTQGGGTEFSWGPTRGEKEETKDYQTALWAAEQLRKPHDRPFFLAVGLSKPHLPFYCPQEFFDLYDLDQIEVPKFREDDLDDILTPQGKKKFRPTNDFLWLKQNNLMKDVTRAYLAVCSYADACLGVMFDALEKSPYAKNTVVIVWGDHGWHLGEKLRYRKATGWSESTRMPLLVRTPGMTQRQDCSRLVNLIDLYPTLIDLCDLPEKPEIDGRSFVPLLTDPSRDWIEATVTIHGEGNASVRSERWRYIKYADGTEELYDLLEDPMEWDNLIQHMTPEAVAAKQRLALYVPKTFAKGVKRGSKALKKQAKGLDLTLKAQRNLDRLK